MNIVMDDMGKGTLTRVELQARESLDILAGDKLIAISVLDDGTVNIATPDGGIAKIWPDKLQAELD